MSNPAETLYNEIKECIQDILEGVTEEEKNDILNALERDALDAPVLKFNIAEIMENI
jgi:hypothetical protein|tara:strand:+ start:339 stop:509 length:171 start_codon:yes stop_codon:yes gene_type:complete